MRRAVVGETYEQEMVNVLDGRVLVFGHDVHCGSVRWWVSLRESPLAALLLEHMSVLLVRPRREE